MHILFLTSRGTIAQAFEIKKFCVLSVWLQGIIGVIVTKVTRPPSSLSKPTLTLLITFCTVSKSITDDFHHNCTNCQ